MMYWSLYGFYPLCFIEWCDRLIIAPTASIIGIKVKMFLKSHISFFSTPHIPHDMWTRADETTSYAHIHVHMAKKSAYSSVMRSPRGPIFNCVRKCRLNIHTHIYNRVKKTSNTFWYCSSISSSFHFWIEIFHFFHPSGSFFRQWLSTYVMLNEID